MNIYIKTFLKKLWTWAILWLWIILSIWILGTVYAYTNLPTVSPWNTLSATIWNDVVSKINDIWNRTDNIYSSWGNVWIGISSPTTDLDVSGQIKISGWTPGVGKVLTSDTNWLATWQSWVSGKVLQVGYVSKTDSWSQATTLNNFYDVPGLSLTITPDSVNSKILLTTSLYAGSSSYQMKYRILRNWVPIILGAGEGGRPVTTWVINLYDDNATINWYQIWFFWGTYQDSPSTTSAVTYKIQMASYNWTTVYLNRSHNWQNFPANGYDATPVSSMVAMEIAN